MSKDILTLSQISIYNTQRVSDEQSRLLFVARTRLFKLVIDNLRDARDDAPPQHHLFIGQRGMGKTTLLKRIEVELRSKPLCDKYIPLLFPEEQYNLDNLDTFWLNCLDSIADVLEHEGRTDDVAEIDEEVDRLSAIPQAERGDKVYQYFNHIVYNLRRRPVLLIDNINFVLGRLSRREQHTLRSYMTEEYAPIIIGASSSQVLETSDYAAPFYDSFKVHYLKRLSSSELMEILLNLAITTGQVELKKEIRKMRSRLKALNQLTGGNPRTAVILFKQAVKGFSSDITGDLSGILDDLTPIYKARFEELAEKPQIIVNAIAMHWDPITLEQIRSITQMENGQISPQLKRLMDTGWIEKPKTARGKGGSYELSERMFNIWYLIRRSSRRQKKIVFCLSKFLEAFYESAEDFIPVIHKLLPSHFTDDNHAITALAIARLVKDKEIRWDLHEKARQYFFKQSSAKPGLFENFDESDFFDGDEEYIDVLKKAIDNHDNKGIILSAKHLLEKFPDNSTIAIIYADACIKEQKYYEAVDALISTNDKRAESLLVSLALEIHDEVSYDDQRIEILCKKALSLNPKSLQAHLFLGKYYIENNRNDEALDILKRGEDLYPGNDFIRGALGEAYFNLENYEESDNHLSSIDLNNNQDFAIYYLLGLIRFYQKRYVESLDYLKQGVQYKPEAWHFYPWIVITLDCLGNNQEATNYFQKMIELSDNLEDIYSILSDLYKSNDIFDLFISHLEKSVAGRPNDTKLRVSLANSYMSEDQYVEAKEQFEAILKDNPTNSRALYYLGYISWKLDEPSNQTIPYLLDALKIQEDYDALILLAIIERGEQHYDQSVSYFNRALKLSPDNATIFNMLSELYEYNLGDIKYAEQLALKAFQLKPNEDPYRLVNMYRDCFGNLEAASQYYGQIPEEIRSNGWEMIHDIFSHWMTGDDNHARKSLSDYLVGIVSSEEEVEVTPLLYLYAKCIEFGRGSDLLSAMEESGMREHSLPEYHAVAALLANSIDDYFDTVAHEIRDSGIVIVKTISAYIRSQKE